MNQLFDIIIIGDSKQGYDAVTFLAKSNNTIKIAFVSREFKFRTTHDFLNVEYVKDEVLFTDYKNRLFGCYLRSGNRFFSTHIIFASGVSYEPFLINNKSIPYVYNTVDDILKEAKTQPAVVIGNTDADIKLAMAVAKKYKQVYLCSETIELKASASNIKKLHMNDKILVLPNTTVIKAFCKDNRLEAVELDNYSKVTCSAIFVKTACAPESSFVSDKLIAKTALGHLKTASNSESMLVPKCYAIGSCAEKSTKKMVNAMYEGILIDFKKEAI